MSCSNTSHFSMFCVPSLTDIFDHHRVTLEVSMSMPMSMPLSMSMSISMSMAGYPHPLIPVVPSGPPTIQTISPALSIPPLSPNIPGPFNPYGSSSPMVPPSYISTPSAPIFTTQPVESSDSPQVTIPSSFPSMSTTLQTTTALPTSDPVTSPSSSETSVETSDCLSTNILKLTTASDESSIPVALDMSYTAESNSSSILDFETELEDELIRTAVFAIFGCNPDTTDKITPITEEIIDGKDMIFSILHFRFLRV